MQRSSGGTAVYLDPPEAPGRSFALAREGQPQRGARRSQSHSTGDEVRLSLRAKPFMALDVLFSFDVVGHGDDFIFEEFARIRLKGDESEA